MYVTLPDLASAKRLADDLLLARIEDRHMHFLARRGTDLGELHEATYLQKTDTVHGALTGFVIGGVAGVVAGTLLVNFPPGGISLDLEREVGEALREPRTTLRPGLRPRDALCAVLVSRERAELPQTRDDTGWIERHGFRA